jgi:hypothetical protein
MQLGDARFVHADLGSYLLHGGLAVVIEANHLLFARRQRCNGRADTVFGFLALICGIWLFGFGRNQCGWQRRLVEMLVVGKRRRRFNGIDSNDGPPQALFVGPNLGGQVG